MSIGRWVLRGVICGLFLGCPASSILSGREFRLSPITRGSRREYGWHGLVGGLLGISIIALWDISDTLTEIQDEFSKTNLSALQEISNSIDEIEDELTQRLPPRRDGQDRSDRELAE